MSNCTCATSVTACPIHRNCTCGITGPMNCPRHGASYKSTYNRMNQYARDKYKSGINEPAKIWIGENGTIKVRAPYQASFVAYAKQFPGNKRRWLKEANIWEFEYELLGEVLTLLRKFYSEVITVNINENRPEDSKPTAVNSDAWSRLLGILNKEDIDSIYRILAKKNHPDIGGSKSKMEVLNSIFSELRSLKV